MILITPVVSYAPILYEKITGDLIHPHTKSVERKDLTFDGVVKPKYTKGT